MKKTKTIAELSAEQKIKAANEAIAEQQALKKTQFEAGYKKLVEETGLCFAPIIQLRNNRIDGMIEIVPFKK